MEIRLEKDFLDRFPEASIHMLASSNVDRIDRQIVEHWKERAKAHVLESQIAPERLVDSPEIQEWRRAYTQFGLKPSKHRSSIEQLWKRALQGNLIQTPINLVNLYCAISIVARAPMGGYDRERLRGDVAVRLAREGEVFIGIGEKQSMPTPPGTVIYADSSAVICFGWNHRDAACSCLTGNTRRAIFFADSAVLASRRRAALGIALLREALESAGCEVTFSGVVHSGAPAVNIEN